ncbi:MAG TPA: phosphoribosylformylglycinamidine synthase subunit PurQ [Hadesarchaea archaeon]|nr:phosphoribosylformylglycinamidine synthase subunit PurQ [Hadesarchaea archaeon]
MKEPKICILRVGGTNCDAETKAAVDDLGARSEILHLNKLMDDKLMSYDALIIPGGFSYGDHVRAGAVLGKKVSSALSKELKKFVEEERPILGICNGFQVLVESGLLPAFDGVSDYPQATLAINGSARYECRWVYLKHENRGKCIFTRELQKGQKIFMSVAHAEGRFVFPKEREEKYLQKLEKNDQLVFRYCNKRGIYADGRYPINPNGAFYDIAGICDSNGTVFGLMPHPERAYWGVQLPDWTGMKEAPKYADGRLIFESLVEYLKH